MNAREVSLLVCLCLPLPAGAAVTFSDAVLRPDGELKKVGVAGEVRHPVRVRAEDLAGLPPDDRLALPSTDGSPQIARDIRIKHRADGLLAWTAKVDTAFGPQSAVFVVGDEASFALIPQRMGPPLRVETRDGRTWLVEGQSSLPQPEGDDFILPDTPDAAGRALRLKQDIQPKAGEPEVHVVVLYNGELVTVWGSNAAVQTRIAYLETISNQAYVDSDAAVRIRVVGAHLVDYSLRNDNSEALGQMAGNASLPIKVEAQRVRAQYGGDLVKLMRNFDRSTQNSCGVGYLGGYEGAPFTPEWGFSVTSDRGFNNDSCGEWTFAHELGHNMGSHHDIETTGGETGAFPYSRGYRQTVDAGTGFATIMAYAVAPQVRIGRFSNPRQTACLGQVCGDAAEADNARSLGETAALVAGFTPSSNPGGLPTLAINDISIAEGNSGLSSATFTLSLSSGAHAGVSIQVSTMAGSALGGADFITGSTTLSIPAGQSSVTHSVQVRGDTIAERDEVFALNILSATGAHVLDGQGVATILKDDPVPTLSIADIAFDEGDAGTTEATFTATLDQASGTAVTFDAKSDYYAPGPTAATAGADFSEVFLKGLRIEAGQTSVQFSIPVTGDVEVEQDERFFVMLSNVVGAENGDLFSQAVIRNDDTTTAQPEISIAGASIQEGDSGTAVLAVPVSLSAAGASDVTYSLALDDGTATVGEDYLAADATIFTIVAGQTTGEAAVRVLGDTVDETDETFTVRLINVVGASIASGEAQATILDDDGANSTSPLVARDDRYVMLENGPALRMDVRANDVSSGQLLSGGSLAVVSPPPGGSAVVDTNGTTGTAADDAIVYTPDAGGTGDDAFVYRLCETGGRCTEGLVQVVRRPALDQWIDEPTASGFRDIEVSGLAAMPDARFQAIGPRPTNQMDMPIGSTDPTPETPWDGAGAGTVFRMDGIDSAQVFLPGEMFAVPVDTQTRILADAHSLSGGDVDLYMGFDDNGNGSPDPEEVRCTAAMSALQERCEIGVLIEAGDRRDVWTMLHSRTPGPQAIRLEVHPFQVEGYWSTRFVATGPGHLEADEIFPIRLSWAAEGADVDRPEYAYITVQDSPDSEIRYIPVRRDRTDPAGSAQSLQLASDHVLPANQALDRLFIDVPEGATSLSVSLFADAPLDLYLAKGETDAQPGVSPAPARSQAAAFREGMAGGEALTLSGAALTPGRWYITPVSREAQSRKIYLQVGIEGSLALPVKGSYYNPDRGGHGLFFYPAGDQWAGLWYTYLQDRSPTWYYLQGGAPDAAAGAWNAVLYRAAWNGASNHLTQVGQARLTATADGEAVFTYRLDGQTGSERVVAFGSGCPSSGGLPVDASSHWFNPAKAGTGYSVQLFPNYEFYAAFVYDGQGVPRFLTAESPSFAGADATLTLEQLTGFCPLCERTGAPVRSDIGTLQRRYAGGTLQSMALDGIFIDGVPGAWTADEPVQTLGGPGTTQGCPP